MQNEQTPAAGPLTAESVKLLQPGDWLLVCSPDSFLRKRGFVEGQPVRLRSAEGGWIDIEDLPYAQGTSPVRFTFLGRPDQDGWIAHKAFDTPPPDDLMVEYITGSGLTSARMKVIEIRWDRDFKWRPHAPVSRPDGEGEAVARVEKYLSERAKMCQLDPNEIHCLHIGTDRDAVLLADDLRTILSLLSPAAPDAGGGALRAAAQRMADDWQSSAAHHPEHVLVRKGDFEALVAALQPGGER